MNTRTKPLSASRRDFLKQAGATAVALALPTIIPASALGADGATAPSERLTLGFIGLGKQGNFLLDAFLHQEGTQVLACCDVESKRLDRAKQRVEKYYAEKNRDGA